MPLEQLAPDFAVYLQVARFFVVLAAGILVTRLLIMPLTGMLAARRTDDKVSVHTYTSLAGIASLFLAFIVALQAAEFGGLVTVLGAITAALTVAVGFGMRDQISNLVGGFFIYADHPFVKGDYIRVGEDEGVVKEISLRQTVLNGPNREKLVIPNSVLTLNPVRNYTKGRKTRIVVPLKVAAGKAGEFESVALEAARENENILEKPEPDFGYIGLEDGKMQLELRCWTRDSKDVKQVKDELLHQVMSAAEVEGLLEQEE
jgi:potassium efflux system protein